MKRYINVFHFFSVAVSLSLFAILNVSCSEWNDHYGDVDGTEGSNLMQLLEKDANISVFASLVKQSGYDKTLSSSQSYTVFAPTNDALKGFDVSNPDSVLRLVKNHIARFTHPTSTPVSMGVKMVNGKVYFFDSPSSFSSSPFSSVTNERAQNGILHEMNKRLPYFSNIYEFIQNNPDYSKLYSFIHQFDEVKFDQEKSTEIDVDAQGRPVYDSVWVNYNRLLDDVKYGIGQIQNEDSTYAMVIPNNVAWDSAYARIKPTFAIYSKDMNYSDSVQDIRTKLAIVNDLVYRTPNEKPWTADCLESTTGSIIRDLPRLFNNTQTVRASNGHVFVTSKLGYDNQQTWNKSISVEAEEQNGRTYNNSLTSVYTRSTVATSPIQNISGDSYIEAQPISSSSNPTLTFDIPGVLSGKYNVYAVFVPASAAGKDVPADSTRISFSIQYMNAAGVSTSKNNRSTTDVTLITSSNDVTMMKAFSDLEFPVSNTTDHLWLMDRNNDPSTVDTTTKLTIQTNVTAREFSSGTYSRTFRLDRIILVPAER